MGILRIAMFLLIPLVAVVSVIAVVVIRSKRPAAHGVPPESVAAVANQVLGLLQAAWPARQEQSTLAAAVSAGSQTPETAASLISANETLDSAYPRLALAIERLSHVDPDLGTVAQEMLEAIKAYSAAHAAEDAATYERLRADFASRMNAPSAP